MQERKARGKVSGTGRKRQLRPLTELLPEMLGRAVARNEDFIVTSETDPDTGKTVLHILSGRFVTSCMLRKLIGQVISQREEGALHVSRKQP